jgi:hypothetical protein
MFSSRDRPAKPSKHVNNTSLSNGISSPGKQASEAPHTEAVASANAQRVVENSRPKNVRTPSHHTMKNDTYGNTGSLNADITILVKSTTEVSTKYETQFKTMAHVQELTGDSVESVLDFIAADRLRRVPHRGSRWDRILRLAEHFAIRISLFQDAVGTMFSNSEEAARMIFASCRALLKAGQPNLRPCFMLTIFRWALARPTFLTQHLGFCSR